MEVKNLSFAYDRKKIIDDVSFEIAEGKITTLLGANGCGKSTLFNLMTKNLIPDRGEILLEGKEIRGIRQREFAQKVAIVHQNNTASSDITVEKLVSYGRTPHQHMFAFSTEEDQEVISWALTVTGLTEYRERTVMSLSGGQRQRVWIAMALAQKTEILFLDEPTTYLDIRYQIELLEMVQKINREYNITIVMVLHDMNHAIYYSDEIIGLKDGKIYVKGDPNQVVNSDMMEQIYGIRLEILEADNQKFVRTTR